MMVYVELNVLTIVDRIGTESDAYELLEELRWNGNPRCAHCGAADPYYLRPANGESRRTRTGTMSERRVWKCKSCRKQFSVLTGTIFHGSKIPVRTWLLVIFEMCANKNGVAAREVERKYNLTPKSAWFMLHRIREAMKREPLVGLLKGTIVADETYMGGNPLNMHARKRPERLTTRGRGTNKTAVLSLVNKETGEVRSQIVPNVTGATLGDAIRGNVDVKGSVLHTDKLQSYTKIGREFDAHGIVDHGAGEYVRDGVSTNQLEGYFSQLKRSIDGTHHHVSVEHLPRYLAEFDYRYSTRKMNDSGRTKNLLGQVEGKRLSYKPLSGNV